MPNRFYLINGTAEIVPSVLRGQWDTVNPAGTVTIPLNATKSGGSIFAISANEGITPNPNRVVVLRGVSEKLAAQTLSGTMNVILGATASDAAAHYYWAMMVWVTVGDSIDLPRGGLLLINENLTNQWTTVSQSMGLQSNGFLLSTPIQDGDRIVIEIGYVARTPVPLGRGSTISGVVGLGSSISSTFSTPPAVGSGIIVMVAGRKNSGPMVFGACTDNRGNTYSVAVPIRSIPANTNYAITMYYCPRVTVGGAPFTITVTGTGIDNTFGISAVEVTGLEGGILNPARAGSEITSSTTSPLAATHTNLTGEAFTAAFFLRIGSTTSIAVESVIPAWTQELEQLNDVANSSIVVEFDTRVKTFADEQVTCRWTTANAAFCATAIAAFTRASASVLAVPFGFGSIFLGAPVGSSDLVIPSTEVGHNAGSINFSQNILLQPQPAQLSHAVIQTAYPTPPPPAQISHSVIQLVQVLGPTDASIGHAVIQTIPAVAPPLPDMSGLYYLHPQKSAHHDSHYNSIELRIPDPTIKTALLGE